MGLRLNDLLKIAENRLRGAELDTPEVDSRLLLEFFLKADRTFIFLHMADELDDVRCEKYLELIDERASHKPLQYITQKQSFMGLDFFVDERVLIPRADTETLVEEILNDIEADGKKRSSYDILDLCTGSGAIAVSLATKLKKSEITAVDISDGACRVAEKNAELNGVEKRVKVICADMFSGFKQKRNGTGKKKFDIIVSNPPYIESDSVPKLEKQVAEFEPTTALDGGGDGLDFYRQIAENAWRFMGKHGKIFLEIGYNQGEAVSELLDKTGKYENICVKRDLAGLDRIVIAKKQIKNVD